MTQIIPLKKKNLLAIAICFWSFLPLSFAQVAVNSTGSNPDPSAMLHVESTSRGLLIPRMSTSERGNINNPAMGLLVFDTDSESFWFYSTGWTELQFGTDQVDDADNSTTNEIQDLSLSGSTLSLSGDNSTVDLSGFDDLINLSENNTIPRYNGSTLVNSGLHINGSGRIYQQIAGTSVSEYGEDLNMVGKDSPSIRFRQTDEGSYDAQTWDIGGNEQHFYVREPGTSTGTAFPFRIYPDSPTNSLVIDGTAGEVGIGTGNPNFKLHVNGSAGKPGGGSWSSASDKRLKKDIKPLSSQEALQKLIQLEGYTYEWINPELHLEGPQTGFVAQQVESIFPEWVTTTKLSEEQAADKALVDEDGTFKAVSLPLGFDSYLVESIKALNERLDTQEQRIAQLEAENSALKAELGLSTADAKAESKKTKRAPVVIPQKKVADRVFD